jgi:pilus assembly protein Flp/PilA
MLRKLIGFFKEEDGATAVEYALFVALIAAIIVIAVQAIGNKANTAFNKVEKAMP